jgi:hypothetical protein
MNLIDMNKAVTKIEDKEFIVIVTSYDNSPIFKKLRAPESDAIYIVNKKENIELGFSLHFLVNPTFLHFFQLLDFDVEPTKKPAIYVFKDKKLLKKIDL